MTTIRPEVPADHPAVAALLERAFGGPAEAAIVEALRGRVEPEVSLVALEGGRLAGHAYFSPVRVQDGERASGAIALGPVAVEPELQRSGIGSALVRAGLETCRALGEPVVFVLGHPEYYPRFGFRPAAPLGLRFLSAEYDRAFFVLELEPGALAGRRGEVRYRPEFYGE